MKDSIFRQRGKFIFLLVMIGLASLGVRLLMGYDFHHSALLYVGIPFVIALVLILVRPVGEVSWKKRYLIRLIDAFIIMFGSSVVLFEGFVCVAMFIPIYLAVMLIMFLSELIRDHLKQKRGTTFSFYLVPLLLLVSSFEGVLPQWSFERHETVSVTRVVPVGLADIKHNLQQPIHLPSSRPWFLRLFPMPYAIEAGSLQAGDVHKIHFRYYRWFVTNMHEGAMQLKIVTVNDHHIKTAFIEDTSYIANYLHLKGTEIDLHELGKNQTRVTLRFDYERTLDPYWYFAPVTRYGIRKTAEFLIKEVIAHESI